MFKLLGSLRVQNLRSTLIRPVVVGSRQVETYKLVAQVPIHFESQVLTDGGKQKVLGLALCQRREVAFGAKRDAPRL